MASIFRRDDNYTEQPNRNTVDFSFQNNLTTDFGSLRPCFCTPVMPGDSFRIKPIFGLKFLPMVFPVQTRMKASLHFFYVRNRNLWKDWMDFIGKTKEGLVPPYIHLNEQNRKQINNCSLGDFLGIPTVLHGAVQKEVKRAASANAFGSDGQYQNGVFYQTVRGTFDILDEYHLNTTTDFSDANVVSFVVKVGDIKSGQVNIEFTSQGNAVYTFFATSNNSSQTIYAKSELQLIPTGYYKEPLYFNNWSAAVNDDDLVRIFISSTDMDESYLEVSIETSGLDGLQYSYIQTDEYESVPVDDLPLSDLPWRSDVYPNGIPLSALPFRAYESIYNTYYRNAENNPLLINGVPEYNKWIRTNEGGADTNFYPIMYHNWEDDFLTTAVPSPQQGNAPLVGLSGTPNLTIAHDDGTTTQMSLEVDENGAVTAANAVSGDQATQAALIEAVSYGISINDFRNVNSFQRWLENNIRRGYKYKDQIKTHYGVSVRYDELDMPEFIGGTSEPVMVNQISQTVETESSPLGSMAGQASSVGQGKEITHYCDEHGFIIGILCVKPVANYSQLLPKYFNVTDTFDYYFPEFGHIGMQPILNSEVAPLQAFKEHKLNDVFGYQRAWYDLISKTDEVHGLFRTDFRNFLINRTFDGTPELGKEFTVMDPNQINDVFAYTENTDKILGQIYMEISKKTPIPLYGIPKLE